ncbi:hypothetical protein D3C77_443740 [compost metagenome]
MKRSTSGITVRPVCGVSAYRSRGRLVVLARHRPSARAAAQALLLALGCTVKVVKVVPPKLPVPTVVN